MSAQSLLSSVFSCSSSAAPAAAKSLSKRRLRQTRSLDPAIIGGGREDGEGSGRARAAGSPPGERRGLRGAPPPHGASFSTPCTPLERSPPGSALFDEETLRGKRSPGCELPLLARTPSALALSGPASSIFSSPRRWLQQRKGQPSPPEPRPAAYVVWKSELITEPGVWIVEEEAKYSIQLVETGKGSNKEVHGKVQTSFDIATHWPILEGTELSDFNRTLEGVPSSWLGDRGESDLNGLLEFSSAESKVMRLNALFEYSSSRTFGYAVTELS
ncbi:hypothetical protein HGM15179_000641 [Zosterops borbonicus]|uniref:Uncharacterized protein n=1 Tax=Zosterops borbonicus TaxID=364589 RepID=A0A8K1GZH2_9PASS|nr:hypothetical protein HGM15179_000641 [Zosterops borbonicus]